MNTKMLTLTDDYKIGITEIDEEHAYLIQLINASNELLAEKNVDLPKLTQELLLKLHDYAQTHFSHEEAYMEKINDPELPRQKKEHAAFLKTVNDFVIDDSLTKEKVTNLLQYMVRWIFKHILASDMMIGKIAHTEKSEKKDPFAFTKEYETGIELIDEEHKKLFAIICQANELVTAELLHDKYDEIIAILGELKDYTEKHFHDEEEYMKEIGYPNLESQEIAHSAFIEKLVTSSVEELDSIDQNQQQYLIELIDYLLDWLTNHILKADHLIGQWVRENK